MRIKPAAGARAMCIAAAMLLVISLFVSAPSTGGLLVPPWDKLAHFVFYGVIAFLLAMGLGRPRYALLLTCLVGVADEAYQAILPGRQSDAMDLLTDFTAAAVVILAIRFAMTYPRREIS